MQSSYLRYWRRGETDQAAYDREDIESEMKATAWKSDQIIKSVGMRKKQAERYKTRATANVARSALRTRLKHDRLDHYSPEDFDRITGGDTYTIETVETQSIYRHLRSRLTPADGNLLDRLLENAGSISTTFDRGTDNVSRRAFCYRVQRLRQKLQGQYYEQENPRTDRARAVS